MKLLECLSRACEDAPNYNRRFRRATAVVLRRWPYARFFTEEQLLELLTELLAEERKAELACLN